ncbi:LPXTG cell wall anchor domain-containing protein [Sutcliffiella horikoshii]|uniref:LPXTG cell wall anchor domain-containing protein n=1 Tax=Sutcliffiella horikoshii TaxID=79883 RepID=A0A5D4T9B5_9BACI|nr:LPXTG cell wall anchor domain-containing protein [Sutcliffiella horikoshii]TYS72277.1 LPXTG cell wall anchor domain-containing protein [Sutcliffiella horikoshii]
MKHQIHPKYVGITILLFLVLILILIPFNRSFSAGKLIDLDDSKFLNVSHFAPGETTSSEVVIKNITDEVINYSVSLKDLSGSKKFYEKLDVKLFVKNDLKFQGKFTEINKITLGNLESGGEVPVQLDLYFPKESGNDFQALKFDISLIVNAKKGVGPPIDNPNDNSGSLPDTGESGYTLIYILGALLVLAGTILFATNHYRIRGKKLGIADETYIS